MSGESPQPAGADLLTASTSYAEALAELDAILDQLEAGDADIDALAAQVERAAALVRLCRARLDDARIEVTRIVADLDDAPAADGAAPPPPAGAPAESNGNLTP